MEIRVLGNSKLPALAVETAVYPYVGPGKTIEDVEAARQALEASYRLAGYSTVYVDIPEQTVDDGIVRLKVTEGRLARVRIEGAKYFSARRIRAALPGATAGEVPNIPELQRDLASAQHRDRGSQHRARARRGTASRHGGSHAQGRGQAAGARAASRSTINTPRTRRAGACRRRSATTISSIASTASRCSTRPRRRNRARSTCWRASYVTRWGRGERNRFALTYIDSEQRRGRGRHARRARRGPHRQRAAHLSARERRECLAFAVRSARHSRTSTRPSFSIVDEPSHADHVRGLHARTDSLWRVAGGDWTLDSSINFGIRGLVQ